MKNERHKCEVCTKRVRSYYSHPKCNSWGVGVVLCGDCAQWTNYITSERSYRDLVEDCEFVRKHYPKRKAKK